jgi:hypothetical protein
VVFNHDDTPYKKTPVPAGESYFPDGRDLFINYIIGQIPAIFRFICLVRDLKWCEKCAILALVAIHPSQSCFNLIKKVER